MGSQNSQQTPLSSPSTRAALPSSGPSVPPSVPPLLTSPPSVTQNSSDQSVATPLTTPASVLSTLTHVNQSSTVNQTPSTRGHSSFNLNVSPTPAAPMTEPAPGINYNRSSSVL